MIKRLKKREYNQDKSSRIGKCTFKINTLIIFLNFFKSRLISFRNLILSTFGQTLLNCMIGFLFLSSIIWCYMQINFEALPSPQTTERQSSLLHQDSQKHFENNNDALEFLGDLFPILGHLTNNKFISVKSKKKSMRERLDTTPIECTSTSWQDFNLQTCNIIHELNFLKVFKYILCKELPVGLGFGDISISLTDGVINREVYSMRYIGSGLWRQVWKVENFIVLKAMKSEHKYDTRNLDRHRRDALVMERLTSNKYIINTYGFCGTSVLTEYFGDTLEHYIHDHLTNITHRIDLAIDVMKGIQAIHTIHDGPVIHADIQLNQFLVDSYDRVYLNDFNRCRFIPYSNLAYTMPCKIQIPSAPGNNRSPEEYSFKNLTEKIDIFSAANIIYMLFTGRYPWLNSNGGLIPPYKVRKMITNGEVPELNGFDHYLDKALIDLIRNMYTNNPENRFEAKRIVKRLELIISSY